MPENLNSEVLPIESQLENLKAQTQLGLNEKALEIVKNTSLNYLKSIEESICKTGELTIKQFETVGAISYLIGIEYVNQTELNIKNLKTIGEKFEKLKFGHDLIYAFIDIIAIIEPEHFKTALESFKEQVNKNVRVEKKMVNEFNLTIADIKAILRNSLIPVNLTVNINEIFSKKETQYIDILKLNSFINKNCEFLGEKAYNKFIQVNGSPVWLMLLEEAMERYNNQKYAVIYLDLILSVKESLQKFNAEILFTTMSNDFTEETVEKFNKILTENKPVAKEKTENPVVEKDKFKQNLTQEEFDAFMESNPRRFIFEFFRDYMQKEITSASDFIVGVENLLDSIQNAENDMPQNIYHYLKANMEKAKSDDITFLGDLLPQIQLELSEKIKYYREGYSAKFKAICADIPKETQTFIKNCINSCIASMVLSTEDEKQYLVSQILEDQVKTYKQLQQMLELIEGGKILGSQYLTYVVLNKYLQDIPEIKEIFESTKDIEVYQVKLSFFMTLENFFKIQ